jgi:predicted DNA-binding antitoxin AbrB/MazE fold protein
MIRAVVQNGVFRPLDPLPAEWNEGRQVIVEDADFTSVEQLEGWYRELQRLGAAEYEPGEWQKVQAVLNEADEQAKALVRREMGLK